MIVDPGANEEGQKILCNILEKLKENNKKLYVFITHHHHDHVEGKVKKKLKNIIFEKALKIVEDIFPNAIVYGHVNTLQRVKLGSLQSNNLKGNFISY